MGIPESEKRAGDPDEMDEEMKDDPVVDGRIVMGRTNDRSDDDPVESPEHDAEVQAEERKS
jgi:hypothetical protein